MPCMESVSWRKRRRAGKTCNVLFLKPLPLIVMSHISGGVTVFPINCLLWIVCGVVVCKYCMSIDYCTADHVIWSLIMVQIIRLCYMSIDHCTIVQLINWSCFMSINHCTAERVLFVLIISQMSMLYGYHFTVDHVVRVLLIVQLSMLYEYWSFYRWSCYMSIDHFTVDHVVWVLVIVQLIMLYEYW